MTNQFSEKLQEKMEFVISQYIGELHEAGIIEKIKEYYEIHTFNLNYDLYIIYLKKWN
jgi:hydrogenase maturation factor HypF (carbamoyltransferase family)